MIIATCGLGDHVTTVYTRDAIYGSPTLFILSITDTVDRKTHIKVYDTEFDAINAFAAVIVADDPSVIIPAWHKLYSDPDMKPFLP